MKRFNITIEDPKNPSDDISAIIGVPSEQTPIDILDLIFDDTEPAVTITMPNPLIDELAKLDMVFTVDTSEDSSFVQGIGYNFKTHILVVDLGHKKYTYEGIATSIFLGFLKSPSKGEFFNSRIKKSLDNSQ